jgi:Family of unknown function (DUF6116)
MADPGRGNVSKAVGEFAGKLRFPQLFTFMLVVFVVDLVVPDFIPFADEILFGLLTVLLGSLKRGDAGAADGGDRPPPEKDVTPKR